MRHRSTSLALLVTLALGCGKREIPAEPKSSEAQESAPKAGGSEAIRLSAEAAKTTGIVVETARQSPIQAWLVVPGVVGVPPGGRATVTPPVSGRVLRLLASVGDQVRAGQPLAVVESVELAERAAAITEARRGVQAAQAEIVRARSEFALAQVRGRTADQTLGRQRELARAGAFSQPSLQAAQRELSDAQATLEGAQKEAVVHRVQLERSERLYRRELVSRIDLENARLDVEKDRIDQERAAREIEIARAAYERERVIGSKGLANAREVQTAEAEFRAARLEAGRARIAVDSARASAGGARAALASAESAYAALKGSGNLAEAGRLTVVAPIDGRVAHREMGVGQAVERTAELFEIDDLRTVTVVAQVPERDLARVRREAPATVTTDAYPRRTFLGIVATIGGRLDPKTRTLPVSCLVANDDGALRPEMFAQVGLGTGTGGFAVTVPSSAVFTEEGRAYVFVEREPRTYVRTAVTTGRAEGASVEIVRGLPVGARVVTQGVFTLKSQSRSDELKGEE